MNYETHEERYHRVISIGAERREEIDAEWLTSFRMKTIADLKRRIMYAMDYNEVYDYAGISKVTGIPKSTVTKLYRQWGLDRVKYSLHRTMVGPWDIPVILALIEEGIEEGDIAEKYCVNPVKIEGIRKGIKFLEEY